MDVERRNLLLGSTSTLLLSLAPWQLAHGAKMLDVRMWPAEESTRITLEHDSPIECRHFLILTSNPLRFVIDLKGIALTTRLKQMIEAVKANDPYVKAIRIAQFNPNVVRLVIDLKQAIKPDVFLLKPFKNFRYRLVLDLYPTQPKDELSLLLANVNKPIAGDPLGDVLKELNQAPPTPSVAVKPSNKNPLAQTRRRKTLCVLVDPGHGGEDPGAIGRRRTREKDIVLKIGHELTRLINKEPGMKALMTRRNDRFVSLGKRVTIAHKANADLVISLHADAWTRASARGSSVYALSERGASSAGARWLAKEQNEADLFGGVNFETVNKPTADIVVAMGGNWKRIYSLELGNKILSELSKINQLHKRNVEQAGFAVLKGQGIPSVLVETAFISNPAEERRLRTKTYQRQVAVAVLKGIKEQIKNNPSIFRPR